MPSENNKDYEIIWDQLKHTSDYKGIRITSHLRNNSKICDQYGLADFIIVVVWYGPWGAMG